MSQALTESPESLQALAEIIESSRRRANATRLSEENLRDEIRDWLAICSEIPSWRLRDAYLEAYRRREVKSALQPRELIDAWHVIRLRESPGPAAWTAPNPDEPVCYYCDGNGWQRLETRPGYEEMRGCACSMAPAKYRRDLPMREPHWKKLRNGVWIRV